MVPDELINIVIKSFKVFMKRLDKKYDNLTFEVRNTKVEPSKTSTTLIFITFDIKTTVYGYFRENQISEMIDNIYSFSQIGESMFYDSGFRPSFNYNMLPVDNIFDRKKINENHFRSKKKLDLKIKLDAKIPDEQIKIIMDFIHYLNEKLQLHSSVYIEFIDKKTEHMTTGVRLAKHHIKVLCKHRMLVDILRTLAHEWTHEYQHQEMGVSDKEKKLDVGGWGENHANAMAGILLKRYVFKHKELENILF